MPFSLPQIHAHENQKKELLILASKCFFLIQLYNASSVEINTLGEKTSSLGLRLIRFPVFNWRKTLPPSLQAARHVPVEISNYVLLGNNKLSHDQLNEWNNIIQSENIVFICGCQGNIWFNTKRLLKRQTLKAPAPGACIEILQFACQNVPPFATLHLTFHFLLHSLEVRQHPLK